jgi:hypothetical protein
VQLVDPEELNLELTIENTDSGGDTSTATIVVTGGTGSYSVIWSTGEEDVFTISNLIAGTYSVSVTDQNGCISELSFEIVNTTGLSSMEESAMQVSPNPFTSCFNVNAPNNSRLILLDNKGIVVYSASSDLHNTYCPGHIAAGLYVLLIQSDKSNKRIRVLKL